MIWRQNLIIFATTPHNYGNQPSYGNGPRETTAKSAFGARIIRRRSPRPQIPFSLILVILIVGFMSAALLVLLMGAAGCAASHHAAGHRRTRRRAVADLFSALMALVARRDCRTEHQSWWWDRCCSAGRLHQGRRTGGKVRRFRATSWVKLGKCGIGLND